MLRRWDLVACEANLTCLNGLNGVCPIAVSYWGIFRAADKGEAFGTELLASFGKSVAQSNTIPRE